MKKYTYLTIPSPPNLVESEVIWYATYITKNNAEQIIAVVFSCSCNFLFPFLIATTEATNNTAVNPFILA